ncbi:MAG: hypothetical protein AAF497_19410, partial [Planctomycetota bacterium]
MYRHVIVLLGLCWLTCAAFAQNGETDWRADLMFVAEELPKRHVNLYHTVSKEVFQKDIKSLIAKSDSLKPYEIEAELSRIIASVGEGHTALVPNIQSAHFLPVQFQAFKDGMFITRTSPELKEAFGGKVRAFGKMSLKNAANRARAYVSHDNKWHYRVQAPGILGRGEMLAVIGAWDSPTGGTVTYEKNGKSHTLDLTAIPYDEIKTMQWTTREAKPPLYEQKLQFDHWNDWLAESKTLYFKYNRCKNAAAFNKLTNGTAGFIQQNDVAKFVLDLRGNSGGDSRIFQPLLTYLSQHPHLNHPNRLFVIIGPQTFSSALMNAIQMQQRTKATLVGEPTGGKPNHYGEIRTLTLPNCQWNVMYSTRQFQLAKDKKVTTLSPAKTIKTTFADWAAGRDPVLE